jgi:Flp pilus assembly protein TadG
MSRSMLRRFARGESGSVILETALVIGILLALLFGVFDIGRVLYTANNAVSAARDGARIAASTQGICTGTTAADIRDTVVSHFSAYRFGGNVLLVDSVTVEPLPAGVCALPASPSAVRVSVSYPFTWIIPIPRLACLAQRSSCAAASNTRAVHAQAEYRYEF